MNQDCEFYAPHLEFIKSRFVKALFLSLDEQLGYFPYESLKQPKLKRLFMRFRCLEFEDFKKGLKDLDGTYFGQWRFKVTEEGVYVY